MLTRYDKLEIALENRGISFHSLMKRDLISRTIYVKLREGIALKDEEIAVLADAADVTIAFINELIADFD